MAVRKKSAADGSVIVCANLLQDQIFRLPDGRQVTLKGIKSTHLVDPDGHPALGQYGRTTLPAADWEALLRLYGNMEIFARGLVFAQTDTASADDEAADRAELRNGLEPVDVETDSRLKSVPADAPGRGA